MEYLLTNEKSGTAIFQLGASNDGTLGFITLENRTIIIGAEVAIAIDSYGALDKSFGNQGKIILNQADSSLFQHSILVNDDESFISYSLRRTENNYELIKVKFNSDGLKDTDFGVNGATNTLLGAFDNTPTVINLKDGSTLVTGNETGPYGQPIYSKLSKLTASGSLDLSFGIDGVLNLPYDFSAARGITALTDTNGRLLITGYTPIGNSGASSPGAFTMLRFNTDGSLDQSFGTEGTLKLDTESIVITKSETLENGDIILAGLSSLTQSPYQELIALRFNENGVIDTSFGNEGIFTLATQNYLNPQSTVTQEDGKILISGATSSSDFGVVRITEDGVLDTGFNSTGSITIPIGDSFDYLTSVSIQDDGKILLGGASYGETGNKPSYDSSIAQYSDISVARLNYDGTLDTSFGQPIDFTNETLLTSNRLFIMQLYKDSLYRLPELEGLDFWQYQLDAGLIDRPQVVSYFLDAPEFQSIAGGAIRLYLAVLDRIPDRTELTGLHDMMTYGVSTVENLANGMVTTHYNNLSDNEFINTIYQETLNRPALQEEYSSWIQSLSQGTTRGELLYQLTDSAEYRAQTDADVTLALMYIGLLYRIPEQEGYIFWQQALQNGAKETEVIDSFLSSPEYIGRFSSEITMTGIPTEQTQILS